MSPLHLVNTMKTKLSTLSTMRTTNHTASLQRSISKPSRNGLQIRETGQIADFTALEGAMKKELSSLLLRETVTASSLQSALT